jgi:nicotinate dehydrogenase subunit A
MPISLKVNGAEHLVEAAADEPLLYVLRGDLGLNGPKFGCGLGQCGACTVLKDGRPIRSCVTPVSSVVGAEITTLEGLGGGSRPLHPLQAAFLDEQAGQCAYCIPGMIVAAAALLKSNPQPTDGQARAALDGNLCRCGSHNRIVRAVLRAARGGGA